MRCNLCGKKLKKNETISSHIKKEHKGLSKEMEDYLRRCGVSEDKIKKLKEELDGG